MDNDQNNCSQGTGPGSLLCQTRVAQGLSREEVAQRLHLATHQIVSLEKDDYANLPGPTYVRGYLRGYANLLGLKPEQVLAAYATLSGSSKKHSLSSLAPKEEITSQDHQVKFATYAVIAIVLGLAVTWWQGRENEPTKVRPEQSTATPAVTDPYASQTTDTAAQIENTDNSSVATLGGTDVLSVTPEPVPVPTLERNSRVPTPPVATPVRERPITPKPVPTPIAIVPTPLMARPQTAAPVVTTQTASPEVHSNLVLYADEESWVDVRDALQNKLIYETVPAGRRVVLEGLAPLKVFIGNAPGVRVEFDGRPYDISPYKRGLIARFTLGQAPAPQPEHAVSP